MEEITSPSEDRLVDKYTDSLEEANKYNESLEQPAVTEQPEEVDKFSDIGDVAREVTNAVVGGLQQTGSDIVTLLERAIDMARGEDVGGEDIVLTLTSLVHLKILSRLVLGGVVS